GAFDRDRAPDDVVGARVDHALHGLAPAPERAGTERADRRARDLGGRGAWLRSRAGVETRPGDAAGRGAEAAVPRLRRPAENAVPGRRQLHQPGAAQHRPADAPARLLDAA